MKSDRLNDRQRKALRFLSEQPFGTAHQWEVTKVLGDPGRSRATQNTLWSLVNRRYADVIYTYGTRFIITTEGREWLAEHDAPTG